MPDLLKEKYNVFKGVVGLFDTKLSAAVIVTLFGLNIYQFIDRRNSDEKLYGMVIEEVRRQVPKAAAEAVAPIKAQAAKTNAVTLETAAKIDTLAGTTTEILQNIGEKFSKSKK